MQHVEDKRLTLKNTYRWITNAIGTFLFVFFMMHSIAIHTSGLLNGRWVVPYFSYPAFVVCVTLAAYYWIGMNPARLRSYCASTLVSTIILFFGGAFSIPNYVHFAQARSIFAIALSVVISLYSIWYIRRKTAGIRQHTAIINNERAQRKVGSIRVLPIVCLLCICCVLFENIQSSIIVAYGFIMNINLSKGFATFTPFPLAILSAILLVRFVKAEFIPRGAPMERDVSWEPPKTN